MRYGCTLQLASVARQSPSRLLDLDLRLLESMLVMRNSCTDMYLFDSILKYMYKWMDTVQHGWECELVDEDYALSTTALLLLRLWLRSTAQPGAGEQVSPGPGHFRTFHHLLSHQPDIRHQHNPSISKACVNSKQMVVMRQQQESCDDGSHSRALGRPGANPRPLPQPSRLAGVCPGLIHHINILFGKLLKTKARKDNELMLQLYGRMVINNFELQREDCGGDSVGVRQ